MHLNAKLNWHAYALIVLAPSGFHDGGSRRGQDGSLLCQDRRLEELDEPVNLYHEWHTHFERTKLKHKLSRMLVRLRKQAD